MIKNSETFLVALLLALIKEYCAPPPFLKKFWNNCKWNEVYFQFFIIHKSKEISETQFIFTSINAKDETSTLILGLVEDNAHRI